ncbi:MAG: hypothetical protein KME59_10615 [Trichormus sp. ATA11-4-KO1]|jgi:hypothetical protein|nr:hypothetical protein [Trichormus sp. ATA11-4-KO1]
MLKLFLLSGWFRLQPFLNYVVVVMLIAPLVATSGHSTSAKQSKVVAKVSSETEEFNSVSEETATISESDLVEILKTSPINSITGETESVPLAMATIGEPSILKADKIESLVIDDFLSSSDVGAADALAAVELAPIPQVSVSKSNLAQKFKIAHIQSLPKKENLLSREMSTAKSLTVTPIKLQPNSTTEIPAVEELDEAQVAQVDPIGSPHPIPWEWIVATQEAISANGGSGVRHYRSVPVISPDGRYVVYSRVQLEVRPEMYNSKVTSVMFVEDTQTKKLRVMASTAPLSDPLLNTNLASPEPVDTDRNGRIGVLVPVSWSEKSDRFLARKFEGKFNTGDSTDQAVIWDRQRNHINTVAPAREEHEHEKIAVLLGWSKNQPDHALFRAGEMGEEDWPLVQVASDGKTLNTTDTDQPITFGKKVTQVWASPQVASR